MTSPFFDRSYSLRIGPSGLPGREWTDLRVTFSVERSTGGKPNKAKVELTNPDKVSMRIIQATGAKLILHAGYGPFPSLIFDGDISPRGVVVEKTGPDRVVSIEAGDGEFAWATARFDYHFVGGSNQAILARLLSVTGWGLAPGDPLPPVVYSNGVSFFGPARKAIKTLAEDAGVEFSIQDGNVLFLLPGSTTKDGVVVLSPETGLIGSPKVSKKGLNVESLLNPGIRPGRLLSVVSETATGFYRARKVTHAGDSEGSEWTTSCECTEVG